MREETGRNNAILGAVIVSVVKKGLELAGLVGGHNREPIRPVNPDDERRVERLYDDFDTAIDELLD